MIIDSRLEFSDAQALTATAVSTNVIDLGADRDIGPGKAMWLVVSVDVAADATTGDETYQVDIQSGSTATPTAVIASLVIPRGTAAGSRFVLGFPWANERYLRLNNVLGGTTPTITLSAWLTDQEPAAWQAYPDSLPKLV